MPAIPLSDAVQEVQNVISAGNYRAAVDSCQQILRQFPEFATVHQLLGEACLEQGDANAAEAAFREALGRDPLNSSAYLGLGLLAEDRGDQSTALAYVQVAWELTPWRADLREHLVRIAQQLYGLEGRLQFTRAALASMHSAAGRWSRAIGECTAVLAQHPNRVDMQLRLAEALWRTGRDAEAAQQCRAVLQVAPSTVSALLILADVERRAGRADEAAALLQRARTVDPDGRLAASLTMVGMDQEAEFFRVAEIPTLDETAPPPRQGTGQLRIAPAPDFTVDPTADQSSQSGWGQSAGPQGLPDLSLPSQEELEAARPAGDRQSGYAEMLRSLEESGIAPFSFDTPGEPAPAPPLSDPLQPPTQQPPPTQPAAQQSPPLPPSQPPMQPAVDESGNLFSLPSDEDVNQARPSDHQQPGYTDMLRSLEASGIAPFRADDSPVEQETPLQRADRGTDWLGGSADAPSVADAFGGTDAFGDASPPPEPDLGSTPRSGRSDSILDIAAEWTEIDQEIEQAIPKETPRGFTQEFETLAAEGIEPFSIDDMRGLTGELRERSTPAGGTGPLTPPPAANAPQNMTPVPPDRVDVEPPPEMPPVQEPEPPMVEPAHPQPTIPERHDDFLVEESTTQSSSGWDDLPASPAAPSPAPPPEQPVEQSVGESNGAAGDVLLTLAPSLDRLGIAADLFERARMGKAQLMDSGRVGGETTLPGAQQPVTLESLEKAVQESPQDPEARLALAQGLVQTEQWEPALAQYQWLYRYDRELSSEVIAGVRHVAEVGGAIGVAGHRLLGALYRRRGEMGLAASHYERALIDNARGGRS